jgi:hypothetical protein
MMELQGLAIADERWMRGVIYDVKRVNALILSGIEDLSSSVSLKPGEETEVRLVIPNLPLNVDFKKLRVTLKISKENPTNPVSVSQHSTVTEGSTTKNYVVTLSLPEAPINLTVRLDGGETFWNIATRQGTGDFDSPDFATEANAYLDRLAAGSPVAFKFLIKADSPGRASIKVKEEKYSVIQTQVWANPLDDTARLDRNLELDFGSFVMVPLDALRVAGADKFSLSVIRAEVGGSFGPERLLGKVEISAGSELATISNDYALAQAFVIERALTAKPIRCVAVTAPWQVETETELYLEIQTDAGDAPAMGAPLTKATLVLPPSNATPTWLSANFDQHADLSPDTRYWLVVKGILGKARLGLQAQPQSYLQQTVVNRGGQLWKDIRPASSQAKPALLRLIYLPELDNQTAAVEFSLKKVTQALDPGSTVQSLLLDLPEERSSGPATLLIKSHARGSLSLANLIQEYTQVLVGDFNASSS